MKHRHARIASTAALLAAATVPVGGAAVASPPDRFAEQVDVTFLSRTSEECGYDILLHLEGTMTWTDFYRDGELTRSLATYPALFYTFINAATGESVTSRSPDPEHFTWGADGSLVIEVTGLVMHLAGDGERAVQAGRFVVALDAEGEATELEPVGRSDDYHAALCEILAP